VALLLIGCGFKTRLECTTGTQYVKWLFKVNSKQRPKTRVKMWRVFFQNLASPSLPPPPRKKAENMWKTIPFSFGNHISPQDLLGLSIVWNCLQHKPKYLLWKHKLHLIIMASKVPSNENIVIYINTRREKVIGAYTQIFCNWKLNNLMV
jgi:hypothetical protein